jgi:glycosyltransferase involved in cell wall biosynthesis
MITILNVLHLPWFAGTETMFVSYTKMLVELGYRVICLVPKQAEVIKFLPKSSAVEIIESNDVLLARGGFNLFKIIRLRHLVKTKKIKLVFAHSGGTIKLFKKVSYKICPVVGINHGTNPKHTVKADYAIAVTNKVKNDLLTKMSNKQVYVIPNALEMDATTSFSPPIKKNSEIKIGVMARLSPEKGINVLLEALHLLQNKNYKVKLIIAGDGEQKAFLKKEAERLNLNVEFLGWVSDKKAFFTNINIFCLPSIQEQFGLVLLEAMQHKSPIVTTNADGPAEVIKDGITGVVCKKNDPTSLSDSLEQMILIPEPDRILITDRAFEWLQNNYSFDIAKDKLKTFISTITA